jgi:hypothetical protein
MVDLRCGFSKNFLSDKFDAVSSSQIKIKEDNIMEFDYGLGCGVFVNDGKGFEDKHWLNWRSFFF